jgi:Ulp1 family protease
MVSNNDKLLSSAEPSRKRSRIFNTFFYTKLISASGSYSYEAVAGWTRTLDIFELDKILIPINVDNRHWIVVKVSMTKKLIQLYDPMGGHNSDPEPYFHQILRFLSDEHLDKKGGAVLPEFSSWRLVLQDTQLPMQPNAYDCGVFVSAFIYFSVLNLPFHRDSGIDPNRFAADLRFQFARSIMTKIIHF